MLMDCAAYFRRVGFAGIPRPDLATLLRLQRCHLQTIPYENFDVQLNKRLTLSVDDAFAKLVTAERGGWCYEMNGLFGGVLEAIGFRVMPMTGAVMRSVRGETAIGNHLVLRVELDQPYLADVGLADGPIEAIPMQEGTYRQGWRTMRLERIDNDWWRFHNADNAMAPSFDFQHRPADWAVLQLKCDWQQTSADSRFVQNAICVRHRPDDIIALIGCVLKTISERGMTERVVVSAAEYEDVLRSLFGIGLSITTDLWQQILRRHELVLQQKA